MEKRMLILLMGFALIASASAANYHVTPAGSGAKNGIDWNNAYAGLPAALERGSTYYIADGSYGGYAFDDPVSDTKWITIKKATQAEHGTESGWQSSYGDGQAIFGRLEFGSNYYAVDGTDRDETDWSRGAAYGFRIWQVYSSDSSIACADSIHVRRSEIGGEDSISYRAGIPDTAFYLAGFYGDLCRDWIIQGNFIHNVNYAGNMLGVDRITWEYNYIGNSWGKECIRGQNTARNVVIRHNLFVNTCRADCGGCTEGCTSEIAIFANQGKQPDFDGFEFYGNIVYSDTQEYHCCGTVMAESNAKVHSNTIYDRRSGISGFRLFGTRGSEAVDNALYLAGSASYACEAERCADNSVERSSPPELNLKFIPGPSACADECPPGSSQCSGNGYQTCGNYDSDSCLEWGAVTACQTGETCSSGVCSASGNLIANGDFESGFLGGRGNGWSFQSDGTIASALSQDSGYQGYAQKISVSSPGTWGLFFYQNPPMVLGKSYELSFRYKATGAMNVQVCNSQQTNVLLDRALDSASDWRIFSAVFAYNDPLATQARFYTNAQGSYWIDEVTLKESCSEADTDCDGCVRHDELMQYISSWKNGQKALAQLMEAIGRWKNGCL